MNKKRPINLDLRTMAFPLPAIVSILHRISGMIIAVVLPFLLWYLSRSLSSPWDFYQVQDEFQHIFIRFVAWGFLAALFFHLFAGIRHILMDMGIGESLCHARLSAKLVMAVTAIVVLATGVWLW